MEANLGAWGAAVLWAAFAAALTYAFSWCAVAAVLPSIRSVEGLHWTDRARVASEARQIVGLATLMPMVALTVAAIALTVEHVPAALFAWLASWSAGLQARTFLERRMRRGSGLPLSPMRAWATWLLVLTPHVWITFGLALLAPRALFPSSFALLAAAVGVTVLVALGAPLRLATAVGLVQRAGPRLCAAIALAKAASVRPAPSAVELPLGAANAFAFTNIGVIAVTQTALHVLDDAGLQTIVAHEMGHLDEPRNVGVVRWLSLLALTPIVLVVPLIGERRLGELALMLLGMFAAHIVSRRVGRQMEERADRAGQSAEPDSGAYARALASLYEWNLMPAVTSVRQIHPDLYDRMVAAGAPPSWPRPAPPRAQRVRLVLVLTIAATAVVAGSSAAVGCQIDSAATPKAVAVACGTSHSCVLNDLHRVQCWGAGTRGQLGAGEVVASSLPREVPELGGVIALGAGGDTTCAVVRGGDVYCWGRNDHGQVGDGTSVDRSAPTRVLALPPAVAVSVGYAHVCALDRDARAWCWGFNGSGAITPGGARSVATPTLLPMETYGAQIVAGAFSTCVVDVDGRARCLGDAEALPSTPLEDVRAVVLDAGWSCFAQPSALSCFGLRPGGTRERFPAEGEVFGDFQASATSGGGTDHACAIDSAGSLRCFGKNDHGQLAGSMARGPEPVVVALPARVEAVAVGASHTCAVAGGDTWCWGANDAAQLGDGSGVTSLDPVRIALETGLLPSPP